MTEMNRYLCFNLGKEEFAIPLLSIKEVIGMPEVTPVPQAPAYFMGLMNLRGQVISVLDLRSKLSIKPIPSEETSVIILDIEQFHIGVVVDQVNSVQMISAENITSRPHLDGSKSQDYVSGVFRKEGKLILLLEIAKALSLEDKNIAIKNYKNAA